MQHDILPRHNQATLTLANGQKIVLTKGLKGWLATQNNTIINATKNDIIYDAKNQTEDQFSYNTLTTARGEQSPYPLVLADGTKTDGMHIKTVNTKLYTAWKEGNFRFEGDHIQTVTRQLARWYNIDESYEGKMSNETFYADITRNRNISAALKVLQNTKGIHFKIEGRRITVIE